MYNGNIIIITFKNLITIFIHVSVFHSQRLWISVNFFNNPTSNIKMVLCLVKALQKDYVCYNLVVFLTLTLQDQRRRRLIFLAQQTRHIFPSKFTQICTLTKDRKLRLTLNLIFYKTTTCNKLGKIFQRQLKWFIKNRNEKLHFLFIKWTNEN